jgi:hypothetical protein
MDEIYIVVIEIGRLARFIEEVHLKWRLPLIVSPPRQKATTKRPLPTGSRRIAAQPLAHIPTSKRGEVLLIKRMGILSQVTPTSSVSQRPYDVIFTGNLMLNQVAALDESCFSRPTIWRVEEPLVPRRALLGWWNRSVQTVARLCTIYVISKFEFVC